MHTIIMRDGSMDSCDNYICSHPTCNPYSDHSKYTQCNSSNGSNQQRQSGKKECATDRTSLRTKAGGRTPTQGTEPQARCFLCMRHGDKSNKIRGRISPRWGWWVLGCTVGTSGPAALLSRMNQHQVGQLQPPAREMNSRTSAGAARAASPKN